MKGILTANLKKNAKGYAATTVAIALAVAFLLTCLGLAGGLKMTMGRNLTSAATGADLIVTYPADVPYDATFEDNPLQNIKTQVQNQHPQWNYFTRTRSAFSLSFANKTIHVSVMGLAEPRFDPAVLQEGTRPEAKDEIGLEESSAKTLGIKLGDTLQAEIYDYETETFSNLPLKVTGLYKARPGSFPTSYVPDSLQQDLLNGASAVDLLLIGGIETGNVSAAKAEVQSIMADMPQASTYQLFTQDEYLTKVLDDTFGGGYLLLVLALVFPVIAGITAIIVVSVTYNVLFARRRRQLALLRAVGATRSQLRSLVARETLLIGAISSAIGVLGGFLISALACKVGNLADSWGEAFHVLTWPSVLGAFVAGVVISFLAGFSPSRRVSQVTPIEALATEDTASHRRQLRVVRTVLGTLLFVVGTGVMIFATVQNHNAMRSLGEDSPANYSAIYFVVALFAGVFSFLGLVLLTSIVLPYATAALGHLSSKSAVTWRLAAENTKRNPRRTGATGAALTLGITLMVLLLVGAASVNATAMKVIDENTPVDLELLSDDQPLPEATIAAAKGITGVERSLTVNGLVGRTVPWREHESAQELLKHPERTGLDEDGGCITVEGMPCDPNQFFRQAILESGDFSTVTHTDIAMVEPGQVGIPYLDKSEVGQPYAVISGDKALKLIATPTAMDTVLVNPADVARLTGKAPGAQTIEMGQMEINPSDIVVSPRAVLMQISPKTSFTDIEQIGSDLQAIAGESAYVTGSAPDRAMFTQMIEALMWGAVIMLGVSVLVALVGVANTLALSVMERRRENGMLRALGMTKGSLQAMFSVEALLTAAGALIVGVLAGLGYAIAGLYALPVTELGNNLVLVVPPLAIAAAVITIVVALLASIGPARAAARVTPVEALVHD